MSNLKQRERKKCHGMMTPGTIATLASIDRRNYDSAAEFAKALKWVIEDNQLAHPPEDGILEQKGYDFRTSKFSFFHIGYIEDLEGNSVNCTVNLSAPRSQRNFCECECEFCRAQKSR